MLVMSRKKNESLCLGPTDQCEAIVTVIEIRGDKVRLGIQVPRDWHLHRSEVFDAIKRENTGGDAP